MRLKIAGLVAVALITLAGCSKSGAPAGAQHATVSLKDGSTFSGAVTQSSNDAITLKSPGGESRTYPMAQVSGVQYADAAPVAAAGTTPPPIDVPPPPPPDASSSAPAPPPSAPAPAPVRTATIPAGTTIQVRNNDTIDSQTTRAGQAYSAIVAADVPDANGGVAIPRGSNATLVVKSASGQGKVEGRSDLVVDLDSVEVAGRRYQLDTSDIVEKGTAGVGKNKRTALFTGGGAVLGTVLGAVAGGGHGAAIGAASGAAVGAGAQTVTRGRAVRIPSETVLNFRLEAAARIREAQ
jgi:hypothetical protein